MAPLLTGRYRICVLISSARRIQSLSSALSSHSIDIIIGIKEIVEARHHARGNFYMVEEAPLCCILSENGGIFSAGEKRRHGEEKKVADGRMTQGTESEERLSYDDLSPEKMKTRFGVTEHLTVRIWRRH